ncbi:MAG: hypothetical protein CMF59_11475 [Leptospiraceae bacterium]|nr:hypothetical protein [Leptospiraceae bacterium]
MPKAEWPGKNVRVGVSPYYINREIRCIFQPILLSEAARNRIYSPLFDTIFQGLWGSFHYSMGPSLDRRKWIIPFALRRVQYAASSAPDIL